MAAFVLGVGLVLAGRSGRRTLPPVPRRVQPAAPRLIVRPAGELPWRLEGAALAGPGLLVGGLVDGQRSTTAVFSLPGRRLWARLPVGLHDTAAAYFGGRVYVLGGGTDAGPVAAIWAVGPQGARAVGRLPWPLSDQASAAAGKAVYLVGGYTGTRFAATIFAFSPSAGLRLVGRLPVGVRYAAAAAYGGWIYVCGGLTPQGIGREAYRFRPATGTWERLRDLPVPLMYAQLVPLGGRLFLVGGKTATGFSSAIWVYSPRSRRFVEAGHLPEAMGYGAVWRESADVAWWAGGETERGASARVVELAWGRVAPAGSARR